MFVSLINPITISGNLSDPNLLNCIIHFGIKKVRLSMETWLGAEAHTALPENPLQFSSQHPASGSSKPPVTLAPGIQCPSSNSLASTLTCTQHIHTGTYMSIGKFKIIKN